MEQNKIWEYYQNEGVSNFDTTYKRLAYLSFMFKEGDKVLNIGVGGGNFEAISVQRGVETYSLDPDATAIERMRQKFGEERAKAGYIDALPFEDEFFDGVVVSEVFEHLSDKIIEDGIKEIARVLKKDGKLVGTTPYKEALEEQLCVCPKCGEKFHRWGHIQSFDEARMSRFLGTKLSIGEVRSVLFLTWNAFNFKGKISGVLQLILFKLGALSPRNQNLFFEAYKK